MSVCHALDWFLLGAMASMYVLITGIALWRMRDMLRDSAKRENPDKETGDGQ